MKKKTILKNGLGRKKVFGYDSNDVPSRESKAKTEERDTTGDTKVIIGERDTTGDTKVFQVIRKEDIEREKRKQAIKAENATERSNDIATKFKDANMIKDNKTETNSSKTKNTSENCKTAISPKVDGSSKVNSQISNKEKQYLVVKDDNKAIKPVKPKEQKDNIKTDTNQASVKNKSKKNLVLILFILVIMLILIILSTIFGVININSNKIVNGVKVHNVEVSNLTKEEAVIKLNNVINNSGTNYITVKHGEYVTEIHLEDIQGRFNTETAVDAAFDVGRGNNIVIDNFRTIESMLRGTNIDAEFTYNQELLEKTINRISLEIPDLATASSYVITDNKVVIKNSKDGVAIKKDEFIQNLVKAFASGDKSFELPVEKVEKEEIDIESIHNEVYKAPVNASYTTNPYQVFKEENGLDFAMSMDEVKKMLSEDKTEFEIELVVLKPQVTVADLDAGAFPDTLGTFTTTYGTADTGRNTNIAVAARSINNAIVMPGEEFSFNDLIGECSTRTGYKESTIYLNGQLSTGIGGGICQVSTTLYNAVLRANLEIVQRRNHSMGVTYVPAGHDAMVNIGTSDFKFKNNREYPVKVVAFVGTGSVTCQIQGLKQDTEYEVKLESRTIEKNDIRYKVETYKVLYLNGNVVSRTWLSTDTYKYH